MAAADLDLINAMSYNSAVVSFLRSFFLVTLFLPTLVFALEGENCPAEQVLWGPWVFNRQYSMADGCLVQVTPLEKPALVYREYVFDENGRWLVFDSIDGPYETATAQQNFFLFPAVLPPRFERRGEQMVVIMANGGEVFFSATSRFVDSTGAGLVISEDPQVDLTSGGHLRIEKYDAILLDTGWKIGDRAYRDPQASSRLLKTGSAPCSIVNADLFAYRDPITGEEYYQPRFKYPEPERLRAFVQRACGF